MASQHSSTEQRKPSASERFREWLPSNWDVAATVAGAIVVSGLAFAQVASEDVLAGATLAVLALVAVALIRDRLARETMLETLTESREVSRRIETLVPEEVGRLSGGMQDLERSIAALDSPLPYEVVTQTQRWDLEANGDALITKTQEVRFIRNARVIEQRFWGSGSEGPFHQWVVSGDKKRELPVATFKGSQILRVVNLGRVVRRGEVLEFLQTREVQKQFVLDDEDVEVAIDVRCQQAVFEISWPPGTEPVDVTLDGPRPGDHDNLTSELQDTEDGRKLLVKELRELRSGHKVTIHWKW